MSSFNDMARTERIVKEFCQMCLQAHQCWEVRRQLFDLNPDRELLRQGERSYLFTLLLHISQEHWMLQVIKLHDPAMQSGRYNLSIDYILNYLNLPNDVLSKLKEFKENMESLSSIFKVPRNRILSHYDLETILAGECLGEFESGKDLIYFKNLQSFVNLLYDTVVGGSYPFDDLIRNDVEFFMHDYKRGCHSR